MSAALWDAFGLQGAGGVVSIVGAGGKTTLMFRLATELAANGKSVLTTTTTKIFYPTPLQSPHVIIAEDPLAMIRRSDRFEGLHMTAAAGYDEINGKLTGYPLKAMARILKSGRFQWILIEADGAAGRPLKTPAPHEPVIPEETTALVAVIGLDAVGGLLTDDLVFRSALYARLTGLSLGGVVTVDSVCKALMAVNGIMKGCPMTADRFVFLNKAETPERRIAGRQIGKWLADTPQHRLCHVLMGCLRDSRAEIESLFPAGD
jgi:probable selenium-dependent hydroxylase accessory protein YqeC